MRLRHRREWFWRHGDSEDRPAGMRTSRKEYRIVRNSPGVGREAQDMRNCYKGKGGLKCVELGFTKQYILEAHDRGR